MEIFKLVGSIFVDTDKADESLKKTDDKASKVGETFAKGVKTAAKWSAGVVSGASAAVTGIVALANNTASAADEIDKMSQKLGLSREAYQEWDYVLSQAGVDIGSMETGLKTLTNKLDDAKNGSESAAQMFDTLGLSLEDLQTMNREDIFEHVITGFQGMEDSTERAALANDLFGKSGQNLTALFNSTAESTEELKNKAHELGMVMSDNAVNSGVELVDTIDTLKRTFGGVVNELGASVIPLVTQFAQMLLGYAPMLQSIFAQLAPVIAKVFSELVPPLLSLIDTLLPTLMSIFDAIIPILSELIVALMPVIVDLINMFLPPLIQIVQALLPPLLSLLKPLLDLLRPILQLLQPILDLVVAILNPIGALINSLLTPLINVISVLIQNALKPLQGAFQTLAGVIVGQVNGAFSGIMNIINTWKNVFNGLITFITGVFTGNWKRAWEGVKSIFTSVFDGIKNAFKIPFNAIIDGINSFIRGINKIKIPSWVPAVGGKGFSIAELPRLAQGGVLERGQVGLLEGDGAEAVVPLDQNKAWISAVSKDMQSAGLGMNENMAAAMLDTMDRILERLENMKLNAEIVADTDRMFKVFTKTSREAVALGRA